MSQEHSPLQATVQAYRIASAQARLCWIRQYGYPQLNLHEGREVVEVYFHKEGPNCKCCGVPMDRKRWISFLLGDYLEEVKALLR